MLVLRGSLTPASRRQYADVLAGGLDRDDARQRAIELLFERLAVSWTIAGLELERQKELLGRYRMASEAERAFVLDSLRTARGRATSRSWRRPVTPDPEAFAALLCDWCLEVAPGDRVLVDSSTLAEPLAVALHRAILEREAWPMVRLTPPSLAADFYRHGARASLRRAAADRPRAGRGRSTRCVRIDAPANTNELAAVDPALIARAAAARGPLQELRLSRRWCGTLLPTPALAQQAGMDVGRVRGVREPGAVPRPARSDRAPGASSALARRG